MLRTETLAAERGDRFELWARRRDIQDTGSCGFLLWAGDHVVFQIPRLPFYFEFFAYAHHRDSELVLEWDDAALEISLFYRYNPRTVAAVGLTFLELGNGTIQSLSSSDWPALYAEEPGRPQLRFSPLKGWMNDPNGLCRIDNRYHLFYQFHPNGTDWGPMHWGHATSEDLFAWTHYPVFQHPEHNLAALGATGGAFSGNAFVDRDGSLSFFYTERLPAYDLFKDYTEVQKRMVPSDDLIRPLSNRTVLEATPAGVSNDIRDPKVWFDEEVQHYRMVLGSAIDGDPAILLFNSDDGDAWEFASVLYRAPARFRLGGARCAECPDFFQLDGRWVLIAGFVGYTEVETGRHNLLYAVIGDFEGGVFMPTSNDLQELDFGTDYYAMQSFWDGERQLAFAWLFNWEFRKPEGSAYSGELSLPRELSLNSDKLAMRPEAGIAKLREASLHWGDDGCLTAPGREPIEISLSGDLTGVSIEGISASGARFEIAERDGRLYVRAPEDDGSIVYRSPGLRLVDLRVFFDRGVIEIFANEGTICGTRRSYGITELKEVRVSTEPGTQIRRQEAYSYRSSWAGTSTGTVPVDSRTITGQGIASSTGSGVKPESI